MIEATARAEEARSMSAAWTQVALAWDAIDRCSRYRPECLTEAAQYARAAEDAAKEGDVDLVKHFVAHARLFGNPE